MGGENKAVEAVEAAAEAIEAVEGVADKGEKKASKLQKLTSLALAVAAVVTSIGAFIKTCDHSVTESAYDTLAQSITKLSDNQEKLGEDVANLHGYLEGMRASQVGTGTNIVWADAGVTVLPPTPIPLPTVHPAKPFKPAPTATVTFNIQQLDLDAGVVAWAPAAPAPTLPPVNPPPAPVAPPSFDVAAAKK